MKQSMINYMRNKKTNWFNTSWFCWNFLPRDLIFESIPKFVCYGKSNE